MEVIISDVLILFAVISRVLIVTSLHPREKHIPFAADEPILRPVNEPGPLDTATVSVSLQLTPASSKEVFIS